MAWLGSLAPNDRGRSSGKTIYLRECAACHGDSMRGSPPQFPSLLDLAARMPETRFAERVRQGGGRMPAFAGMQAEALHALAQYVLTGADVTAGTADTSPSNQPF